MSIHLYNVPGMNMVDMLLPQSGFLDDYYIGAINDGYYPPFYQNRIRINLTEIELSQKADENGKAFNYAEIRYTYNLNGSEYTAPQRSYYYYVTDIEYVAENVIEATLTMDTLTTYWDSIKLSGMVIQRKALERWKQDSNGNWLINRDYIPEQLSEADQELIYSQSDTAAHWGFMIRSGSALGSHEKAVDPSLARGNLANGSGGEVEIQAGSLYSLSEDKTINPSISATQMGGCISFIPYVSSSARVELKSGVTYADSLGIDTDISWTITNDGCLANLSAVLQDTSNIISVTPVPLGGNFGGMQYSTVKVGSVTTVYFTGSPMETGAPCRLVAKNLVYGWTLAGGSGDEYQADTYYACFQYLFPSAYATASSAPAQISSPLGIAYDAYFNRSTSTTNNFAYRYVPALFDDQYYKFVFAYNGMEASPILRYSLETKVTGSVTIDFESNAYLIATCNSTDSGNTVGLQYNPTSVVMTAPMPTLTLWTDAWEEYKVNHQGSLITDWIGAGLQGLGAAVGVATKSRQSQEAQEAQAVRYEERTQTIREAGEGYITGFRDLLKDIPKKSEIVIRDPQGKFRSVR